VAFYPRIKEPLVQFTVPTSKYFLFNRIFLCANSVKIWFHIVVDNVCCVGVVPQTIVMVELQSRHQAVLFRNGFAQISYTMTSPLTKASNQYLSG